MRLRKNLIKENYNSSSQVSKRLSELKAEKAKLDNSQVGKKEALEEAYILGKPSTGLAKQIEETALKLTAIDKAIKELSLQLPQFLQAEKIKAIESSLPVRMKHFEDLLPQLRAAWEEHAKREIEHELALINGNGGGPAPTPLQGKDIYQNPVQGVVELIRHMHRRTTKPVHEPIPIAPQPSIPKAVVGGSLRSAPEAARP